MTDVFRICDAFTVLKTQEVQKDEGKSLPLSDFQPSSLPGDREEPSGPTELKT